MHKKIPSCSWDPVQGFSGGLPAGGWVVKCPAWNFGVVSRDGPSVLTQVRVVSRGSPGAMPGSDHSMPEVLGFLLLWFLKTWGEGSRAFIVSIINCLNSKTVIRNIY